MTTSTVKTLEVVCTVLLKIEISSLNKQVKFRNLCYGVNTKIEVSLFPAIFSAVIVDLAFIFPVLVNCISAGLSF